MTQYHSKDSVNYISKPSVLTHRQTGFNFSTSSKLIHHLLEIKHGDGMFKPTCPQNFQFQCNRHGFLCFGSFRSASCRAPSCRELLMLLEGVTVLRSRFWTREEFELGREPRANELQRRRMSQC